MKCYRCNSWPCSCADGITLIHGDCREVLPQLPAVDLVLTDPPYGIGADKANAHSSIRDNKQWADVDWDSERPPRWMFGLMLERADTVMIWGGNYFADALPPSGGWLCWRKPEAETGFSLADVELCWTNLNCAARLKSCARRDGNLHPTQKPVDLMKWSIGFARDAKSVCDPYAGSGTTLIASKQLGRKAIGIEIEERYCEIAANRLRQEVLQFTD